MKLQIQKLKKAIKKNKKTQRKLRGKPQENL